MRRRRKGAGAVAATVEAEANSEALQIPGDYWLTPPVLTALKIIGISDRAIAAAIGVTEMQAGNYIHRPLFTPTELQKLIQHVKKRPGPAPSDPATKAAGERFIKERTAKTAMPPAREQLAVAALRRTVDAMHFGLRVHKKRRDIRGRAGLLVIKAKIQAAELVLAYYDKQAQVK